MSRALRAAAEEMSAIEVPRWPAPWHPHYTDASGNTPPCFIEFMRLSRCVDDGAPDGCTVEVRRLLRCLAAHGVDSP